MGGYGGSWIGGGTGGAAFPEGRGAVGEGARGAWGARERVGDTPAPAAEARAVVPAPACLRPALGEHGEEEIKAATYLAFFPALS